MKSLKKIVDQYTYLIEWAKEDNVFVAKCIELGIMAHGNTHEEAVTEAKKAALGGLKLLSEDEIPEPFAYQNFSGRLVLRISPEKHKAVTIQAKALGVSINHLIASKL